MGNPDGIHFTQAQRDLQPLNVEEWSKNLTARSRSRPAEWHKNVEKDSGSDSCFGTNINRNFAFHWQGEDHTIKVNNCLRHNQVINKLILEEENSYIVNM